MGIEPPGRYQRPHGFEVRELHQTAAHFRKDAISIFRILYSDGFGFCQSLNPASRTDPMLSAERLAELFAFLRRPAASRAEGRWRRAQTQAQILGRRPLSMELRLRPQRHRNLIARLKGSHEVPRFSERPHGHRPAGRRHFGSIQGRVFTSDGRPFWRRRQSAIAVILEASAF